MNAEIAQENSTKPKMPVKKIAVAVLVIAGLVALFKFLPISEMLSSATAWVDSLGFWGPLAFMAIYVLCVVFFIPASILTATSGVTFGILWGSIYVSIASTIGATLAFLIGRHFARGMVEGRIKGNEQFSAIDQAVANEGWKIVGLTRLSPIFPFALLNYGYGITKVKLSHYVLASWIGMMPGTILYVYIGSLSKAAAEGAGKSPLQWAGSGLGFLATILVTVYITKIARRALDKRIQS